ncbi:MAG: hypothetical protein HUJ31_00120, partial [Pseudomonadales bacterium]|nr:hypothetical protein [Pseudomonadales bacterium]
MIYYLGQFLSEFAGPFRLFTSYIFLAGLGTAAAALLTWWLLPKYWNLLPMDRGREYAVDADKSVGKPMSAGILFIPLFAGISLLVVPFDWMFVEILLCVLIAMVVGYLDDLAEHGWSEYRLGAIDLVIAFFASLIICQFEPYTIWLPLFKDPIEVGPILFIMGATPLIWLSL